MPKNTIIVSDLHLTPEFDIKKYNYLRKLFQSADQIIIDGDLWSYYYCDFTDFLDSKWNQLFPLMLEKKCVYIFGNHDREEWCDERTKLFSIECHNWYSFSQLGTTFHVQHGHLISSKSIQNEIFIKYLKKFHLDKYNYAIQQKIINKLGSTFYSRPGKMLNKKHKKFVKKFIPKGEFLICGHTQSPEGSSERRYINTGFINYGHSSYLQIYKDISLVQETY